MKKKSKDPEMEEEEKEDIGDWMNKGTRYLRTRVLIKWTQTFFYNQDIENFKVTIKDIIINEKLGKKIPDRSRLRTKLDEIIESYMNIQILEYEEPQDPSEEEEHKYFVEVSYNILERKLGEIITSSVKAIIASYKNK